jgi:hypothetical protein
VIEPTARSSVRNRCVGRPRGPTSSRAKHGPSDGLAVLRALKFKPFGRHPLEPRHLNLVEQISWAHLSEKEAKCVLKFPRLTRQRELFRLESQKRAGNRQLEESPYLIKRVMASKTHS